MKSLRERGIEFLFSFFFFSFSQRAPCRCVSPFFFLIVCVHECSTLPRHGVRVSDISCHEYETTGQPARKSEGTTGVSRSRFINTRSPARHAPDNVNFLYFITSSLVAIGLGPIINSLSRQPAARLWGISRARTVLSSPLNCRWISFSCVDLYYKTQSTW